MSRFNSRSSGVSKTLNHEGAVAYTLQPDMELYSMVATASLQKKFYESDDEFIDRLREVMKKVEPSLVARLAVYAREKMYLRSIPIVLLIELNKLLASQNINRAIISKLAVRTIQRADEITETLSYYQLANSDNAFEKDGKKKKLCKLSKQLQKGVAEAFHKFDEYQFAKYNRKAEVTLKDALFLCHPKPEGKEEEKLFKAIADDTLKVPYTWETQLSELGQQKFETEEAKAEAFKAKWEELIDSGKVGYMALLRNLRNILNANVSAKHIKAVAKVLSDKEQVKKSKQLPFRFLSAYRELEENESSDVRTILDALEKVVLTSAENIKGYDEKTTVCIACDVSGSMEHNINPRSKVMYYDIGLMLGMLLQNRCKKAITGIFGDIWKVKNLPKDSILRNTMDLHRIEGEVGYSTNGYKVLEYLISKKLKVDKIMMFTDCQMWDSDGYYSRSGMIENWNEYKKINPNAKLYLFDMTGYGNTPLKVNEKDVFLIAGWSDKIFDVFEALENGEKALDEIRKLTL